MREIPSFDEYFGLLQIFKSSLESSDDVHGFKDLFEAAFQLYGVLCAPSDALVNAGDGRVDQRDLLPYFAQTGLQVFEDIKAL